MWEQRNKILHNKSTIHKLHGEDKINYRIAHQLSLGKKDLFPNDYHLIKRPLSVLQQQPFNHKKEWLKTIEAARTCQLPDEMKVFDYTRNFMSNWLGTKSYRTRYKTISSKAKLKTL